MVKKLKNIPVLCLTLVNLTLAIKNGFNWLNVIALGLSAIVLVWDVWEAIKDGRK